jgi:hypothetical protein
VVEVHPFQVEEPFLEEVQVVIPFLVEEASSSCQAAAAVEAAEQQTCQVEDLHDYGCYYYCCYYHSHIDCC